MMSSSSVVNQRVWLRRWLLHEMVRNIAGRKRQELGGLFTYGMLNFLDIPRDGHNNSISEGIFKEWHELVRGKDAFGIVGAMAAFKS